MVDDARPDRGAIARRTPPRGGRPARAHATSRRAPDLFGADARRLDAAVAAERVDPSTTCQRPVTVRARASTRCLPLGHDAAHRRDQHRLHRSRVGGGVLVRGARLPHHRSGRDGRRHRRQLRRADDPVLRHVRTKVVEESDPLRSLPARRLFTRARRSPACLRSARPRSTSGRATRPGRSSPTRAAAVLRDADHAAPGAGTVPPPRRRGVAATTNREGGTCGRPAQPRTSPPRRVDRSATTWPR